MKIKPLLTKQELSEFELLQKKKGEAIDAGNTREVKKIRNKY